MTQALRLTPVSRVLEIGTGSGYQSAVLASITPHVWSVETLAELAGAARERLHGLGYPVEVTGGDGRPAGPNMRPTTASSSPRPRPLCRPRWWRSSPTPGGW